MGSSTPAQFAGKMFGIANQLDNASAAGVAKAALFVKQSVQSQLGGVTRLRGVGRRGANIGVRYDVLKKANEPAAIVRMSGPAHLIERDTSPHTISPRARRSKSGRAAVRLADGSVRNAVQHPGTRGKHPFEKGVNVAAPHVPRLVLEEQVRTIRTLLG